MLISISQLNELVAQFQQREPHAKCVSVGCDEDGLYLSSSAMDESNVDFTILHNYTARIFCVGNAVKLLTITDDRKRRDIDNPKCITYPFK